MAETAFHLHFLFIWHHFNVNSKIRWIGDPCTNGAILTASSPRSTR